MITPKKVAEAVRSTVSEYMGNIIYGTAKIEDPYDINCGLCEEFALDVIHRLTGQETDYLQMEWIEDLDEDLDCAHAVITLVYGGKVYYFDAECPDGTIDLWSLPVIKNSGKDREEVIAKRKKHVE